MNLQVHGATDAAVEAPLFEVRGLTKHFPLRQGALGRRSGFASAVDGVSFTIGAGETLALVGESGCGKTTTARMLLLLEQPTSGSILVDGEDVTSLRGEALLAYRHAVQAVFQNPYRSLSPRMKVGEIVGEPLTIHLALSRDALRDRVRELLEQVGLTADKANSFPHQLSGGQRQRVAIARALALDPRLIILDEPVSALDVSIRAQVLNLLADLQQRAGVSFLLISHDLAIVEHMSHRVAVMYAGRIVEIGDAQTVYANPRHPYTRALLSAVPRPDPDIPLVNSIGGEMPSPISPPSGCRFHPRCPLNDSTICPLEVPVMRPLAPSHEVACFKA